MDELKRMETLLRNDQPGLKNIERLDINNFQTAKLDNDIPVFITGGVEEPVVRIDLRFRAGRWYETGHAVSRSVSQLMKKGTSKKSSKEIADAVEFYGGNLEFSNGHDYTGVTLFCLTKYTEKILPVVLEILTDASYPQEELDLFIARQKQKLRINAQNTDFHANRKFNALIFGENHPYGYALLEEHLNALRTDELIHFQREHYKIEDALLFVSGNVDDSIFRTLNTFFGSFKKDGVLTEEPVHTMHPVQPQKIHIPKSDSVQSSIRIGCPSISKDHPDYPLLYMLTVIYGGYFGSRLMSNIREDKGYTYGIYSSGNHFLHGSYFEIDTEVGNEVCEKAIKEIYSEMDILRSEPVGEEELTIVRNYVMGSLLRATDGPFNRINLIRSLLLGGQDISYFERLVHVLKTATPDELMQTANKYFVKERMVEVVCGK